MGEGGLPLPKGGGSRHFFSHAEGGGGTECSEVVSTQELEVLAILMGGGVQKVSTLSNGGRKSFTMSQNVPKFCHFWLFSYIFLSNYLH